MFTRIKNKKEKIVLPQANRLFAPPAASAAERSKTIFCRFHAVILTTGAKKKNSISRLFPVCRPLTTGTEKKSLFSRLPPPGVLYHRREKINLDFSASPSGHPSRRRRKAELIFPASPVCRPSFRCRKAKLVFPVFPSVILTTDTQKQSLFFPVFPAVGFCVCRSLSPPALPSLCLSHKPAQSTIFYHKPTACLPPPPFPRTKKGLPPTFSPRSFFLLFRPSLLFPQSPNGFMPCPFPAPACFFFPSSAPLCLSANSEPFSNPEPYFLFPLPLLSGSPLSFSRFHFSVSNRFPALPSPAPACFFPNFSQTVDFDKKNRAPTGRDFFASIQICSVQLTDIYRTGVAVIG